MKLFKQKNERRKGTKFKQRNGKAFNSSTKKIDSDSKKNIWICHYGGGCISVYNIRGKKIHKVNLPAKNITNCTFGGPKNNELYATSALKDLKRSDLKKYNLSGSLFNIMTNTKGVISKPFNI